MGQVSPIYAIKDRIEWYNWSERKKKAHVDAKQF